MEFILWLLLFVYQPAAVYHSAAVTTTQREPVRRIPIQNPVLPRPILR